MLNNKQKLANAISYGLKYDEMYFNLFYAFTNGNEAFTDSEIDNTINNLQKAIKILSYFKKERPQ